ncbi:mitogen-activated protein kinase kinase kinase A-like [Actinia tenebrosa]|uniref:Mitogen-activated protein kinase kinase kinase A-like n=1 Tax=Actinia tenebrosa TaxID=6105 RepID=A0A6P8J910_ACTTE|nr:mitogen-activated protein kinase kinase kinase A-like [Actinia tenebrosa]
MKPYDCSAHLSTTLNEFKNLSAFKRECVVEGELYDMINLEGTISVVYKGFTYHIPLRVMLMEDYPLSAPIIYVKPTANMILDKNVPYVNGRGKISTPYLDNWDREQHPDLFKILHDLCIRFAQNPPVWTKRTDNMVKVYESRNRRLGDVRLKESRQERQAVAPVDTRQGQTGYPSYRPSSSEPSQDMSTSLATSQENRPPLGSPTSVPESQHPSALGTSSVLPKTVSKNTLESSASESKSVAYDSQSSSGSSSATPSPSQLPSGEGFIPFDPAQAVSSPGSFVPAFNYTNNNDNFNDTAMERKQPSTSSEGHLLRSRSVPVNLSRQKSCHVLSTYKRRNIIGSGGFAKVFLYENENTGEKVACKIVNLGDNDDHVQKCAEALKKEIRILRTLKHEFVISYLSTEEHENDLAMIMEYFPKGSLYSELQRRPEGHFDEPNARLFTWQIIQGVKYLHENGVIHKDIKARNILIDDSNIIKIADFGISKKMDALVTATTTCKDNFASIYWQSPEYLRGEKCGRKTDVWSIGCTVVEMLVGQPPLLCDGDITKEAAGMRILRGEVYPPDSCSEIAKEFLEYCFRPQETRPKASELMGKTEFPSPSV